MSGIPSPFTAWFDAPEHADVVINVRICKTDREEPCTKKARTKTAKQKSTAAAAAPPARSFNCHAVILAAQSGYFKAQLSSIWQPPKQAEAASGSSSSAAELKRHVNVHIEPGELDAMQELLRMMYSQVLPPAAAPGEQLLLQCLRLADQFQASSCMELLLTALAAVPQNIGYEMLGYVFKASPGVEAAPAYPALLASATKALVRLFGDVPKVITEEGLLQQFCALPHVAVLAWAKSDELRVQSENCVVFLMSAWVNANQDSTAQQHEELANQIRVFHLGPAYLHQILPSLSWFEGCSAMQHLPAVQCCIRAGAMMKDGQEKNLIRSKPGFPSAWMSPPRRCSNKPQTCSWVLSSRHLKEMDRGIAQSLSPVYVNGFLMGMGVKQATVPSAAPPGKTLEVYCSGDWDLMDEVGLAVPDNTMLPIGCVLVRVGSTGSQMSKEGRIASPCIIDFLTVFAKHNFLGGSAPTLLELLGPYLQEGQLHVQATFNGVDMVL